MYLDLVNITLISEKYWSTGSDPNAWIVGYRIVGYWIVGYWQ